MTAHAGGIAVRAAPGGVTAIPEHSQSALIWSENGLEHLLLAVSLDVENKRDPLLWITSLPASPTAVKAEVLLGVPALDGLDVGREAISRSKVGLGIMAATQLWPAPAILSALSVGQPILVPPGDDAPLQREGVTLEVIAASSLDGLDARVRELGSALSGPVRQTLERYVSPQGSFLTYRVDAAALAHNNERSLRLGFNAVFPSANGHFPLAAGATSSAEALDISVTALGFVQSTGPHPAGLQTSYYVGGHRVPSAASGVLAATLPLSSDRFTRFEFLGPRSSLSGDLSFAPGAPALITIAASLITSSHGGLVGIAAALLVFVSTAALVALAARGIWPNEKRPRKSTVAVLGVLNLATVVAPLIGSLLVARRMGAPRARALAFVAVSSVMLTVVFIALVVVVRHLGP